MGSVVASCTIGASWIFSWIGIVWWTVVGWIVSLCTTGWTRASERGRPCVDALLTGLVDVMVGMLLFKLANVGTGTLDTPLSDSVLVLSSHLVQLGLMLRVHVLLVLAHHRRSHRLGVLGRKGLMIFHWLDPVLNGCQQRLFEAASDIPDGGERVARGRRLQLSPLSLAAECALESPPGLVLSRPRCRLPS